MSKYTVVVLETRTSEVTYEIEADNEEEANDLYADHGTVVDEREGGVDATEVVSITRE